MANTTTVGMDEDAAHKAVEATATKAVYQMFKESADAGGRALSFNLPVKLPSKSAPSVLTDRSLAKQVTSDHPFRIIDVKEGAIDAAYEGLPVTFRDFISGHREVLASENLHEYWSSESSGYTFLQVVLPSYLLAYFYLTKNAFQIYNSSSDWTPMFLMFENSLLNYAFLLDCCVAPTVSVAVWSPTFYIAALRAIDAGCAASLRWMSSVSQPSLGSMIFSFHNTEMEGMSVHFCDEETLFSGIESSNTLLRDVFAKAADCKRVPLKSIRFSSLSGRPLYVSEIRNKTLSEVGIMDGDVIVCEAVNQNNGQGTSSKVSKKEKSRQATKSGGKSKKKMRQQQRKKRKNQPTQYKPSNDAKTYQREHSKKLSLVFEEAHPIFKAIRMKVNSLGLKRTPPKLLVTVAKPKPDAALLISTSFRPEPVGGKAGKIFYDVKVGEVASLYKTSKPSRKNRLDRDEAFITIDLHGCTRDEGKAELESSLPRWIRMAMEGSHPWVIRVRIVCGGGCQVLSEMVEEWIGQNESVAKAFRG